MGLGSSKPSSVQFSSLEDLFGPTLEKGSGFGFTSDLLPTNGMIAIYFSASWCPPCRTFTPMLAESYNVYDEQGDQEENFRIVFVSSDRSYSEFTSYFGQMPWLALPFKETATKKKLSSLFGVRGIPMLVVIDSKTGKILSANGRADVAGADGNLRKVLKKWAKER